MPTEDLLPLLRHELRDTPGIIPRAAEALCRVFTHQMYLRDQQHADLINDWRRLSERVRKLEQPTADPE